MDVGCKTNGSSFPLDTDLSSVIDFACVCAWVATTLYTHKVINPAHFYNLSLNLDFKLNFNHTANLMPNPDLKSRPKSSFL